MITKKEAALIRKAATLVNKRDEVWSCYAVNASGGPDLVQKYAEFFGQKVGTRWKDLHYMYEDSLDADSMRQILQRELMLELFAHTRGKL